MMNACMFVCKPLIHISVSSSFIILDCIFCIIVLLPYRMEVHDIVQEAEIKTIPKKKECKKAKGLSEEALQRAMKRREAKGKGKKERCTHLNAEF